MSRFPLKNVAYHGIKAFLLMCLLSGTALAAPLPDGSSGSRGPMDPRKRWESMSEERKADLLKKYRRFKSLPETEKKRLRDRHKKLEGIRENILSADEVDMETQPEVSKDELNGKVRTFFHRRERELKKRFPMSPGRKRPDNIRYLRKKLEDVNRTHLDDFLKKVTDEGFVSREEADRIKSFPRPERMKAIFEIGKDRFLRGMEGLLTEEILEDLQSLDPLQFNMLLHLERERRGMIGPAGHMLELTPEQAEALHALPEGPERERLQEKYQKSNLKEWLKKLGEDTKAIEKVLSMPPRERQRYIMKKLQILKRGGRNLPPEVRKLLDGPFLEKLPKRIRSPRGSNQRPRRRMERNGRRRNGNGNLF